MNKLAKIIRILNILRKTAPRCSRSATFKCDIYRYKGNNPKKCSITRNIDIDASNALELVGHREHLRSLNPFDRIMVFILIIIGIYWIVV